MAYRGEKKNIKSVGFFIFTLAVLLFKALINVHVRLCGTLLIIIVNIIIILVGLHYGYIHF